MKRVLVAVAFFVLAAFVLGACNAQNVQGSEAQQDVGAKIGVRGEITMRNENPDGTVTLLVEGENQEDTEYGQANVTLDGETSVLKDGAQASTDDLQKSVRVEVEITGPVAESYPVQARASVVRILTE